MMPSVPRPLPCRTCCGPPASTRAFSCATPPSTASPGLCSSSLLSGRASFRLAGVGQGTHRQRGPLAPALHTQSLHVPVCSVGTAGPPPWGAEEHERQDPRGSGSGGRRLAYRQPHGCHPREQGCSGLRRVVGPALLSLLKHQWGEGLPQSVAQRRKLRPRSDPRGELDTGCA